MSKYAAFISYRHGGIDEQVAIQIHKEIERYRLPKKIAREKGIKTLGKLFRDAEELRATSNLSEIIREAIRESEWLIVLCTRRYQESVWCMEEIEYFIELRGRERVIVVLIEGEPNESFPKILTEIEKDGKMVHIEPLAVDVRGESDKEIVKNVKTEKFRFLAQMLDVDYDDLRQRQRERQRRQIISVASAIFLGISTFAGVVMMKNIELDQAYDTLDESMQQTLRGQSYYLSEYANEAYQDGDRITSALLSLEALPQNLKEPERPFVQSVIQSLTQALGIYDYSSGYQTDKVFSLDEEAYDTKAQISADEKVIMIEKYMYTAGNMLQRKVYVYNLSDKSLLGEYDLSAMNKSYYTNTTRSAYLLKDSKTLVYLGIDGLKAVDIYTGDRKFSGYIGDELVISENEDVIAITDYTKGYLHFYDGAGQETLECEIGTQNRYTLGGISPDSRKVALVVTADTAMGIMLLDTKTGKDTFINQRGECSNLFFINNEEFCFICQDFQLDIRHIVVYNCKKNAENYVYDADWALQQVCVTNDRSCLYFHNKTLHEVAIESGKVKSGKEKWNYEFPANVLSITMADNICGVTCSNGQSYFFDMKTRELINSMSGNSEGYYMLTVNKNFACMRDYWGQNIRIYKRQSYDSEEIISKDLSDIIKESPDKWYTCASAGDKIMLGLQNGNSRNIQIFDGKDLSALAGSSLPDLSYDSFDNLSIDIENPDYISIHDNAFGENKHFRTDNFKKVFEFNEDSYYYYSDDWSTLYVSEDNEVKEYDAASGEMKKSYAIPASYDRGLRIGDSMVYGSDESILIQSEDGGEKVLKDARIYTFHESRGLLFYRNTSEKRWFIYSLTSEKIVCQGEAGNYSCTTFFGDRYFLNDYSEVYDMDTWKRVLDLSEISNSVYGVQTTEDIPYFIVWCQNSDTVTDGKASGSNMAYLYSKENTREIVGMIPNFVAATADGKVIVFDGDHTLYRIPLYTVEEIVKKAKNYVGNSKFADKQIEKYHLYAK
jgi:MTH538 TIR-like domain (DUF1863).